MLILGHSLLTRKRNMFLIVIVRHDNTLGFVSLSIEYNQYPRRETYWKRSLISISCVVAAGSHVLRSMYHYCGGEKWLTARFLSVGWSRYQGVKASFVRVGIMLLDMWRIGRRSSYNGTFFFERDQLIVRCSPDTPNIKRK